MDLQIDPEFRDLLLPLSEDERHLLEKSILEEGCHDPLLAWSGTDPPTLLDGHNRYDICTANGLPCKINLLDLPDHDAARNRVIEAQLAKRNITPEQASYLRGTRYNDEKGKQGGTGANQYVQKRKNYASANVAKRLAAHYGVYPRTIQNDGKFAECLRSLVALSGTEVKKLVLPRDKKLRRNNILNLATKHSEEDQQKILDILLTGEKDNYRDAQKLLQERKDAEELKLYKDLDLSDVVAPLTWEPQKMEELLPQLSGLDAIITDPPYPEEYLSLYGDLARFAKDCLKEDGILAVMCGQSYLPTVMALMTEHITYRWTLSYLTPGGQAVQLWDRDVNTFWKPILLFGGKPSWIGDVVESKVNDNDKRFHNWGQSESGMANLIEALTRPGQTVCDPFMGAGTTGVVCVALGRKFVGCDINPEHVQKAEDRMRLEKGRQQKREQG